MECSFVSEREANLPIPPLGWTADLPESLETGGCRSAGPGDSRTAWASQRKRVNIASQADTGTRGRTATPARRASEWLFEKDHSLARRAGDLAQEKTAARFRVQPFDLEAGGIGNCHLDVSLNHFYQASCVQDLDRTNLALPLIGTAYPHYRNRQRAVLAFVSRTPTSRLALAGNSDRPLCHQRVQLLQRGY